MNMPEPPTEQEKQQAFNALAGAVSKAKALKASVDPEKLEAALCLVTKKIKHHYDTGQVTRMRRFLWSIWNQSHFVNLYDLTSGLDSELSEAMVCIFTATAYGALPENRLRRLLDESGEFDRLAQARKQTPEDGIVLYPWPNFNRTEIEAFLRQSKESL